jgi:uncharacterized membrane-anchored protein
MSAGPRGPAQGTGQADTGGSAPGGARTRLDPVLQQAMAAGLLPPDTRLGAEDRPWPVILLTGLGAWLAAVPLLAVVVMLLGDLLTEGAGPYLVGVLLLAAALVILRSQDVPLFVEQLAVPALLVGLGSLGFGLFDDLSTRGGAAWLALMALALAAVIPRGWLRVLLGAAGAGLCIIALVPWRAWDHAAWSDIAWLGLHGVLGAWVAGLGVQWALLGRGAGTRVAAALESIGAGWLSGALVGLAAVSGMTFLVGAGLDPMARELIQGLSPGLGGGVGLPWRSFGSAVLTVGAILWAARTWPGLRRPWILAVGLVAAGLAWFLPNLGGVWVALVLTATTGRWRLATAAALASAWIIGSFYYQLQWPLAIKALVLVGAGALLAGLARLGARTSPVSSRGTPRQTADGGTPERWAIGLTLLATLSVVNFGIWDKETLIAHGQPLFVELAPVDPRSLMQGDYMRLGFRVPAEVQGGAQVRRGERCLVVARRDGRGVANLLRRAQPGESLADGELLLELTPKGGRWILVSDAWYFREGEAKRWEAARYGEFRATPDGRALLVGLADRDLRPIGP